MTEPRTKAAGAFVPVALVFLAGLTGGIGINVFFPIPIWHSAWAWLAGVVPLVAGIWLFASARQSFRRHQTALMPWTPTARLVQDGPFRFTRNPIYLAFGMMYLSAALIFNSAYILVMLAVVLVLFDRIQIPREEGYLQEKFGEEFSAYRAKVRRWI